MKTSTFTNPFFFWVVISILGMLILWNLYLAVTHFRFIGLLPIGIQVTLLILIFRKHEYAKIGIKLWATIFLITGSGLQLAGRIIKDITGNFANVDLQYYLTTGITLFIGIVIVNYTNKTIEIIETGEEQVRFNPTDSDL